MEEGSPGTTASTLNVSTSLFQHFVVLALQRLPFCRFSVLKLLPFSRFAILRFHRFVVLPFRHLPFHNFSVCGVAVSPC